MDYICIFQPKKKKQQALTVREMKAPFNTAADDYKYFSINNTTARASLEHSSEWPKDTCPVQNFFMGTAMFGHV